MKQYFTEDREGQSCIGGTRYTCIKTAPPSRPSHLFCRLVDAPFVRICTPRPRQPARAGRSRSLGRSAARSVCKSLDCADLNEWSWSPPPPPPPSYPPPSLAPPLSLPLPPSFFLANCLMRIYTAAAASEAAPRCVIALLLLLPTSAMEENEWWRWRRRQRRRRRDYDNGDDDDDDGDRGLRKR